MLNPRLSHLSSVFGASFVSRFCIDVIIVYYLLYALFDALLGRVNFNNTYVVSILTALLYCISSVLTAYFAYNVSIDMESLTEYFMAFTMFSWRLVLVQFLYLLN
jgi:hypothetical protein